jgi:methionine synthase II (cobalamin-independent)
MGLFDKKAVNIKTSLGGSCPPFTGIWKSKIPLSKMEKEHLLNYREISTEFQDSMGLDIVCEGEVARSVDKSHPFYTKAYIYYFAQFLEGVDNNICIKNKISLIDPTFINEDYQDTKKFTKKPVKITLPGPVLFVERVKNEYYKNKIDMIEDYSLALKKQIESLIDLGVEYIQIGI